MSSVSLVTLALPDTNAIYQIVSAKNTYFYLFVLLYDRIKGILIESRRYPEKEFHGNACENVIVFRHVSPNVIKELGCGKRVDVSKFLWPSADVLFLYPTQRHSKFTTSIHKSICEQLLAILTQPVHSERKDIINCLYASSQK